MRIKLAAFFGILIATVLLVESVSAFEIDFSRRRKRMPQEKVTTQSQGSDQGFLGNFFGATNPGQEVVILNTEKGFIPNTVRLQKGNTYTVYVVNVNTKEKNVSFVLDNFAQYHSTFFGKIKEFKLHPKDEGVFSFQCPETSIEGRMVIYSGKSSVERGLASDGE